MRWQEKGGPPVAQPVHKGFGSQMIQRGLTVELQAVVRLDYPPDKLRQEIQALALAQAAYGGNLGSLDSLLRRAQMPSFAAMLAQAKDVRDLLADEVELRGIVEDAQHAVSIGDLAGYGEAVDRLDGFVADQLTDLVYDKASELVVGLLGWDGLNEEIQVSASLIDAHSECIALVARRLKEFLVRLNRALHAAQSSGGISPLGEKG